MVTKRTTSRTSSSAGKSNERTYSGSFRGSAGLKRMEEEQRKAEARKELAKARGTQPFRFWVPVGETRSVVVVDEAPEFFRLEHALKGRSGRFDLFLPCIDDEANCPVCKNSDKPAYFAMYLTVIDLSGYEDKDGNEVEWSKKLLVVKPGQQKKITRLYEKHGSLRGMILDMTRDGEKDAAIGNDIEFVEFMEEEELEEYITEYEDKDGKVHEIVGGEVYDYDEIFPAMTERQLAAAVGAEAGGVGNREDDDRNIGRGARRATSRGRAAAEDADNGGDDGNWEGEGGRRASSRSGRSAGRDAGRDEGRTATRRAPRRAADDDVLDEGQDDDAPAPEPATTRRGAGRRAPAPEPDAPQRTRRAPREEAENDPPFDGGRATRQPAEGAAARRANLRGRR